MLPDKNNRNYYRVTQSGKYTMYYYPQKIRKSDDLVWMHHLNRVSCKAGTGVRQRKGPDADPGGQLGLDDSAYRRGPTAVEAARLRLRGPGHGEQRPDQPGRAEGAAEAEQEARQDAGLQRLARLAASKAVAGLYVHHKFATISGPIGGRNVKITLTGSQNFTGLGTTANNDLVLRVVDGKMVNQYNTNFAFIRGRWTKRMRSVPLVTRKPDRVGGA